MPIQCALLPHPVPGLLQLDVTKGLEEGIGRPRLASPGSPETPGRTGGVSTAARRLYAAAASPSRLPRRDDPTELRQATQQGGEKVRRVTCPPSKGAGRDDGPRSGLHTSQIRGSAGPLDTIEKP